MSTSRITDELIFDVRGLYDSPFGRVNTVCAGVTIDVALDVIDVTEPSGAVPVCFPSGVFDIGRNTYLLYVSGSPLQIELSTSSTVDDAMVVSSQCLCLGLGLGLNYRISVSRLVVVDVILFVVVDIGQLADKVEELDSVFLAPLAPHVADRPLGLDPDLTLDVIRHDRAKRPIELVDECERPVIIDSAGVPLADADIVQVRSTPLDVERDHAFRLVDDLCLGNSCCSSAPCHVFLQSCRIDPSWPMNPLYHVPSGRVTIRPVRPLYHVPSRTAKAGSGGTRAERPGYVSWIPF